MLHQNLNLVPFSLVNWKCLLQQWENWRATLLQKSFSSLQASPFVAYYRPQIFAGKSKPAEVPALVNSVIKGQVCNTMGIQTPHRPEGILWPARFDILVFSHWLDLWRHPQRFPRLSHKRHLSKECTAKFRLKLPVLKTMQSNKLSHSIICLFHKYVITSFGKHYYSAAVRGGTPTSPVSSDIFAHCCSWAISKKGKMRMQLGVDFFLLLLF